MTTHHGTFSVSSVAATQAVHPSASTPHHENISCLLEKLGMTKSLDFLGKTVVFEYRDSELRSFFPKQEAKVLSVVISDPSLNRALELEVLKADALHSDFISLDRFELLQVM